VSSRTTRRFAAPLTFDPKTGKIGFEFAERNAAPKKAPKKKTAKKKTAKKAVRKKSS
jgi:hypothetical protein